MSETHTREQRREPASKAFALADPPAEPPRLGALQKAVQIRRKSRQRVRAGLAVGTIVCVLGLLSFSAERGEESMTSGDMEMAHAPLSNATIAENDSTSEAMPFRVFAEVNTRLPVFVFDEAKDAMVPVGWAHASDLMPVELGPLSNEQMDYFESVLHQNPDSHFISL